MPQRFSVAQPEPLLESEIEIEASAPLAITASPALETPVLETPVLETPALETPVLETPALEPSAPEPPVLETRPPPLPSEWPDVDVDSLGPSQMDALPELSASAFRDRGARRAWWALGVAACAGALWLLARTSAPAPETTELPPARPSVAASPSPAVPAPVDTPVAHDKSPEAGSLEAAQREAPSPVQVAVRTWPPDAVLFESGRRLGSGVVTVEVPHGSKVTLVAQREGFRARKLILDGTKTSVAVALGRAPTKRASSSSRRPELDDSAENGSAVSAEGASNTKPPTAGDAPSAPSIAPTFANPDAPSDSEPR